jgi:hypothetical protein
VGFAIASNTVAAAVKKIEAGNGVSSASASQSEVQSGSGSGGSRSPYGSTSPNGSSPYGEVEAGGSGVEAGVEAGSGQSGVEVPREVSPEGSGSVERGSEGQVVIVP